MAMMVMVAVLMMVLMMVPSGMGTTPCRVAVPASWKASRQSL
jgi:hypothetical protein